MGSLVRRVRLRGPPGRGGTAVVFDCPVFIERHGLALHPAWGTCGPETLGPMFCISAPSCGWRVAAFRSLEAAEAAFVELEAQPVKWSRMGAAGTARYAPTVRQAVVRILERHGATFQRRSPKPRKAVR